ncbi:MAG: PAS domain-containing protein [Polyangiaceae bacterium]
MKIKLNHVTGIVLATVLVLGVALIVAYQQIAQARDSYVAEVSMHETLAAVRQLQIVTRALQSERADYPAIQRDWEEVRRNFPRQLSNLEQALHTTLPDRPQLKRINEIWRRMEVAHEQIGSTLIQMKEDGLLAQIGTSSLVVVYQDLLGRRGTPDVVLGGIGLLLFQLEHTDRMVLEIEFELKDLARNLEVHTTDTVRNSRTAAASVVGIATILVLGLLVRIAMLYSSLESDNAARRTAEQAAKASANDLNITLNSIADAVIATDTSGRVVQLNPAATRLLALARHEALGRPARDLFGLTAAGQPQAVSQLVDEVIDSGRVAEAPSNTSLVRTDKVQLQISAIATPIRDDTHTMSGVVLVVRDITEQSRLADQLRRTQRIESMGQLAGGVAHDFNNLLLVVKANASFLGEDPYLSAESRQFLGDIELAVNRAADLTKQLLALGRRQTLQIKELESSRADAFDSEAGTSRAR